MTLTPSTREELAARLRAASGSRSPVVAIDLRQLNRVLRYAPEDLTVTVEAGITLDALQAGLRVHGQWLPIDPPAAGELTIAELLDRDLSGPRRQAYGTLREHLLGVRVALADGRIIRSGGEVVKNVAGYDLMKVFVGAQRSLGVIVEAAFKLLPRPQTEVFVTQPMANWDEAARTLNAIQGSPVTPTVLDFHNLDASAKSVGHLVVGCSGAAEDVEWQLAQLAQLAQVEPRGLTQPGTLEYAVRLAMNPGAPLRRHSVLPSKLIETLQHLGPGPLVARAGLGIIYHRTAFVPVPAETEAKVLGPAAATGPFARGGLTQRLKETFDPAGILPNAPTAWA